MRRELKLMILAIISMSALSSILSSFTPTETDKFLLDTVVGSVGSGNFSYWQLGHTGPLLIELTSLTGDADLYVSDSVRPSYEVHKNNFSSATCGIDLVYIPADFPRPIGIGVFGAWSHSISEYNIQVFLDAVKMQSLATEFYDANANKPESPQHKAAPHKMNEEKPRFFLRLLNILEMIFEMVIL